MSEPTVTFRCNAILFDMDGTLVDSTAVVVRQWRRWATLHHLNLDEILAFAYGRRTIDTMRHVAPHLNFSERDGTEFDDEEGRDIEGVVPVVGAAQVLSSLPANRWAVVTSATTQLAQSRLALAGLPLPVVLVSADDVRQGKPHPEGFNLAAQRLGVRNEECLVIEDTPAGVEAGIAAGMQVLSIGSTVARESLKGAPWIPDFTRFHIDFRDGMEVVIL